MPPEDDQAPPNDDDAHSDDHLVTVLLAERRLAEDQISALNGRALNIIQNMILIIGTGILAATQERSAFIVSPVLWVVWMLYAQQTDRDTRKSVAYSTWLESRFARIFDSQQATVNPVRLRSALATTPPSSSDVVLAVTPPILAFAIHLSLTAIGASFLFDDGRTVAAWIFLAGMTISTLAVIVAALGAEGASRTYENAFSGAGDSDPATSS